MNKLGSGLSLPPRISGRQLKAEIMWGDENGGSPRFPETVQAITIRKYSNDPIPLQAFKTSFRNAMERIWIVDEYFLVPDNGPKWDSRITTILSWVTNELVASDIRILTKEHREITPKMLERFQIKAKEINEYQTRRERLCTIQVNTRLTQCFGFIHDRFAIVDDELWHFGATVGGFHTSVNAASRGWSAEDSGAIAFFQMAWDKCKESK
ncbi:Uncharacterised protein [Serratia fonticola]|uniref:hypothetical protein n=1 Tax=Serratia fonticola TaxID=47917 RepID=UPI00217BC924|nr:hypothetical protein [Serratia fonticola]CAI1187002.1 Uncharacterised protein [Serratia fonticola]